MVSFARHAARNPAAARVVGHQHQVPPGQRDERRQRRALIAALFFFHLNDQFLALGQRVLNARRARIHPVLEILAGNFLERQETVALFPIIDEAGFQTRFDAGNDAFVDIAFALFLSSGFNVQIDQLLAIDNGDAEFFLVRRIEQHAFHECVSP